MGSIVKQPSGRWRAFVTVGNKRKSKVFSAKSEAKAWAARQEYIENHPDEINDSMLLGDIFERYGREVSIHKKGARTEIIRINRLRRGSLAKMKVGDLKTSHFADWRDYRLREVKSSTVRRELEQISAIVKRAHKEWGIFQRNPLDGICYPKDSQPRDRRPTSEEIQLLRYVAGEDLQYATSRAFHAWLFAIETAMRAGEIACLKRSDVFADQGYCHLADTKNGTSRNVPLSREAIRLLGMLPSFDRGYIFGLTSDQISALFRKIRDKSGVKGLTFHDSRHEAITRLASKLNVLELARMVGHKDIRMLQRYYNATAQELSKKLD